MLEDRKIRQVHIPSFRMNLFFRREEDPETRQNATGTYFRLVKEPDSEAKRLAFERALADYKAYLSATMEKNHE